MTPSLTWTTLVTFLLIFPKLSFCLPNFTNPVVFSDFPDNDVFRGPDGAYYFSASSFHYSPGAPILKSYDLVNWDFIGHSLPTLDFGPGYHFEGTPRYVGGVWASTMRYRKSNDKWYWIGCIDFWNTYIYTAPNVTGPWEKSSQLPGGTCYYDCGLLIDDDDSMYVVYGNTNPSISQLSADGLSQVKSEQMLSTPEGVQGIEGNRLYKINGTYYILNDSPEGITYIWRSTEIWGPWTYRILQKYTPGPIGGSLLDQGSLIQAPDNNWYFMSFEWVFPAGRIPVLAPITWDSEGWPTLVTVNGTWAKTYEYPTTPPKKATGYTGIDRFQQSSLSPHWEWNMNPDTSKISLSRGNLTLKAATVTNDLYQANNTLTHRTYGSSPVGTIHLNIRNMQNGDRAGFAAFRDISAWIEIFRDNSTSSLRMINNATQDGSQNWATINNGTVIATHNLPATTRDLYLRIKMNTLPASDRIAKFQYSLDGTSFTDLGDMLTMSTSLNWFLGYRFAIFNFATRALGGSVSVVSFENQ